MADKEKCEHCGIEPRAHSIEWLTTRDGDPSRPVEDGPEWGIYRLWEGLAHENLVGVICKGCWEKGLRFKEGFGESKA